MAQAQQALGGDTGGADASKASKENLNAQQVRELLHRTLGSSGPNDDLQALPEQD